MDTGFHEAMVGLRDRAATPADSGAIYPFAAKPCCFVGPEHGQPRCEHWRRFGELMVLAHLRWNLVSCP